MLNLYLQNLVTINTCHAKTFAAFARLELFSFSAKEVKGHMSDIKQFFTKKGK